MHIVKAMMHISYLVDIMNLHYYMFPHSWAKIDSLMILLVCMSAEY